MATEARNHHWVPQCYLKGFARSPSKNAQLFVADAKTGRSFLTSPRNVASARDFNRVDAVGIDPGHVEAGYADFEGLAAPALRRLRENYQIGTPEDHNLILNLIALLAVRTPCMRENVRDFHDRVARQMIRQTIATRERYEATLGRARPDGNPTAEDVLSYEAMRDFVESDEYTIEVSTTRHVDNELNLVNTVLPLLAARSWMLFKAQPGTGGFVTSDHPVGLQWSERKERGLFASPGFGLRGTEVIFPVSHDLLMVGEFDGKGGILEVDQERVAYANGFIIWHSDRQVYARDDRFFYLGSKGDLRRGGDLASDLRANFEVFQHD